MNASLNPVDPLTELKESVRAYALSADPIESQRMRERFYRAAELADQINPHNLKRTVVPSTDPDKNFLREFVKEYEKRGAR